MQFNNLKRIFYRWKAIRIARVFLYDNKNVSEIINHSYIFSDTFCNIISLFYNASGVLDRSIAWSDCNKIDTLEEVVFFYDTSFNLDSSIVHFNSNSASFTQIQYFDTFERIESTKTYSNNNIDFSLEEYIYDNNPNPRFNLGLVGSFATDYQKNNLIKITRYNPDGSQASIIEYSYEYNSANYPINRKRTYLNGNIKTTEFIYY